MNGLIKSYLSEINQITVIDYIENIENIYCHRLSVQYNTMLFVYRMYTKSNFISKRLYIKTRVPNCKL